MVSVGFSKLQSQDPAPFEEFKYRYDHYLGVLDRLAVNQFSTFRRYNIRSTADERDDDYLLYPPRNFFQLNIPAYFVMAYFVRFVDYQVEGVEIYYITVFDTGFTVIYNELKGENDTDYYGLDISKGELEKQLLELLRSRDIKLSHRDDRYEKEIILQIGYHQEPK
jgi:hypothetical protein